ncbi:GNAT family N-acetyltransferase [uncultured Sunxiuqinia sp.]|uniref:GNAT family N-acetyltransferase n=1 Tax=uncultured Sunxiuqinia sp. TaxID=1573825 RepID=UPI00260F7004|nr:GNAT family N-acetyltransferase [uncultured Sunxiuqinia sp.]
MQLVKVEDKRQVDAFHQLPYIIYKDDKNWVPPLRMMVEDVFNLKKNNALKKGNACRWVLYKNDELVGRIAAFHTSGYAGQFDQLTGGVGFFESIDDQEVANTLFDTAKAWLESEGMEAMDGPINLGENFFNWGLLVDGFMQQSYGMNYHPRYYQQLWENYGFQTYYQQFSYHLNITSPDLPERFWKIAAWMSKKPGYKFEHFRFKKREKYITDFIEIYDKAWNKHDNYKQIDRQDLRDMISQSKLILEEEFIWFVYRDGKPIAFFMMIPDVNQLVKYFPSGKMNLLKLLRMLYLKRKKVINRCRVLVMGVVPEFQKSGIESAIFYQLRQVLLKKDWYDEMELSWVGDFNPKMISIFEAVGGKKMKTHLTLRYLFDREKEFKRSSIIVD